MSMSAPPTETIDHLTLPVGDLQQAEAFYVGLLGGRLVRRFDRATFVHARPDRATEADAHNSPLHIAVRFGDGPELHLFWSPGLARRRPTAHPHLAFGVDHDHLDPFRERLRQAGLKLDGPRRLGGPGQASLYFTDPWGQLLELTTTNYRGYTVEGPPDMQTFD